MEDEQKECIKNKLDSCEDDSQFQVILITVKTNAGRVLIGITSVILLLGALERYPHIVYGTENEVVKSLNKEFDKYEFQEGEENNSTIKN